MSGVEWIGFLISFLAMLYLYFNNQSPSKIEGELTEDNQADRPLHTLDSHVKKIENAHQEWIKQKIKSNPTAPHEVHRAKKKHPAATEKLTKKPVLADTKIDQDAVQEVLHDKTVQLRSRINTMIKKHPLKEMMIVNQILGAPKGFTE